MLKDSTAAQLADALDIMVRHPHDTMGLSLLDEATMAFGDKSPELYEAQTAFANARDRHMRSYTTERGDYTDESWAGAMVAAGRLAALLRPLGDMRIARCKEAAGWGTCNLPLDADGACRGTFHVTAE